MEILGVIFIVIVTLIMFFFIGLLFLGMASWFKPRPNAGNIENWVKEGKATKENHTIKRIFEAEQLYDEGVHYFIENNKNDVVYLCGQYLTDFLHDQEDKNSKQLFPSEEFDIYRDKKKKKIYLEPKGDPVMPEFVTNPVSSSNYYKNRRFPKDGEKIRENFDSIAKALGKLRREKN